MISCRSKEALVGGDAETIYLGVRVLDCPRADARESFPETNCVIITSCLICQLGMARYVIVLMFNEYTCTENHTHGGM